MKTLHFFIFESQTQNALSCASVYFPLSFSFRNHAIHLILHYNRTAIRIYVVRKMSHFVLKQIADERKPFISCLLAVITRALITPNHWHPGSGKWQQKHQSIDVALLLWQIFRISNHSIFFYGYCFPVWWWKKKKTTQQTCTQSRLLNVYYYFIRSLTVRTCIWAWQSRARTMYQPARWVN